MSSPGSAEEARDATVEAAWAAYVARVKPV